MDSFGEKAAVKLSGMPFVWRFARRVHAPGADSERTNLEAEF